jgi:hypothetical protein
MKKINKIFWYILFSFMLVLILCIAMLSISWLFDSRGYIYTQLIIFFSLILYLILFYFATN